MRMAWLRWAPCVHGGGVCGRATRRSAPHSFGARTNSLGTRGDHRGGGQVVVREVGFAPAGLLKEGGKRRQQPWELGLERRHIGRLG